MPSSTACPRCWRGSAGRRRATGSTTCSTRPGGAISPYARRSPWCSRPRWRTESGGSAWAWASPSSRSSASSTASSSTPSRRSTRSRSAIWQPAGGWLTVMRCSCSAHPASARRISRWREAIKIGYSVLFTPATTLLTTLARAHAEGRLEDRLAFYAKPKLLIVDELGYLPFAPDAAHLFFQLVSKRYERGSLMITSNRSVGDWGTVFGDPVVATAILDRLLHHSHVLTIRGDSYRLREKRRSGLIKGMALDQQQEA